MTDKDVLVSVLMPVYNGAGYIGEAIDSVLAQTFPFFELLIVNDGSTDSTREVIESYKDPRIRLINQPNGGVSAALNTGLKHAKGEYIARFDADDICYPDRIEVQYTFIKEHPDYILVGTDADYITQEGEFIYKYVNVGHTNEEINKTIEMHCSFIHSSVMYPKKAVMDLGGYEVKAHTFEDYFLWKKLIKRGKVCNLRKPLLKVRFNSSSVTIDEKDHDPVFLMLKKKALQTGVITDEEGKLILKSVRGLSKKRKEGSYNRMLCKKFLWDNYQPGRARKHLMRSLKSEPFVFTSYLLLLLSLLPEKIIKAIYEKNKT